MKPVKQKFKIWFNSIYKKGLNNLWMVHVLIVILVLLYFSLFFQKYFLQNKKRIIFINDNLDKISYTNLHTQDLNFLYQNYQKKLKIDQELPYNLQSPF